MKTRTIMLLMLVIFASGCVQRTAIPYSARPGDFVVVGLGGIHRNASSDYNLNASELNVTITDSNQNTYSVPVGYTFRTYPDYTSQLSLSALSGGDANFVPFDGGWFALLKLVDGNQEPLPLTAGDASLSVTAPQLTNTLHTHEGDLEDIKIAILPPYAEGESRAINDEFSSQFFQYAPANSRFGVRINPANLAGITALGGATIVVNYSNVSSENGLEIVGLPVSHNPWIQIGSSFHPNGDGTGYVRVYILNPHGFLADAGASKYAAPLSDLQVQFLPVGGSTGSASYEVDTAQSYVFDLDGNVVGGLTLEYQNASNL